MSGLRLALFDIDGTLVHLAPALQAVFYRAFSELHTPVHDRGDWDHFLSGSDVGIAREILADHLARPPTAAELATVLTRYTDHLETALADGAVRQPEVFGARSLVRALAADPGWVLGLATGNCQGGARLRLADAGFSGAFALGAFAEDGDQKPDILAAALRRARRRWPEISDARRVVYLGDHGVDAAAARRAGVGFIGVGDHPGLSREVPRFRDFRDLSRVRRAMDRLTA